MRLCISDIFHSLAEEGTPFIITNARTNIGCEPQHNELLSNQCFGVCLSKQRATGDCT